MPFERHVNTIDTHTAGEPTRVVISGLPALRGATMQDRQQDLAQRFDYLRRFLTFEPRGHAAMFGAFVVPPSTPDADVGVIFFKTLGYVDMCGHGTIGVATALIETGHIEAHEPETDLIIETPAGLIPVRASVEDGHVREVTFRNVPAFALATDLEIQIAGLGPLAVDVAYGGNWFAILPASDVGLGVSMDDLSRLRSIGVSVRRATNERLAEAMVPGYVEDMVDHTLFSGPAQGGAAHGRNIVTSGEERFDRSPCGTGTSALMATLYARGQLAMGEDFVHESVVDLCFRGRLVGEDEAGGRQAVVADITGSAYVTGFQHFVLDAQDPLGWGFCTDAAAGTHLVARSSRGDENRPR